METKALKMRTNTTGMTTIEESGGLCLESSGNGEQGALGLKPSTDYACIMMPIPEGYELVTDGRLSSEESEYKKFDGSHWDGPYGWRGDSSSSTYIRPIKQEPEIEINVKINGKDAKLSDISDETIKAIKGAE